MVRAVRAVRVGKGRRRRAAEEDLYRGCLQGRDCPPDIKAKFENNTLADKLLKWFSNFLWFGQLGIGTGRGGGGTGGYTRLGAGGGGTRPTVPSVTRPAVVVEAVGPSEGVPIDAVNPGSSSIVPLQEGDPTLTVDSGGPGGGPTLTAGELETIAEVTPSINGTPDIQVVGQPSETPAVVEVTSEPTPRAPVRESVVSQSEHSNPAFNAFVASAGLPGESTASDQVFVTNSIHGEYIGGIPEPSLYAENIELDTYSASGGGFEELEIEEPPRTSTPVERLQARLGRNFRNLRTRLYGRRTLQRRIDNPRFLTSPGALVRFDFENPAFEDDVSLEFQRDLNEIEQAPDLEFRDVARLSRPYYGESREGHVRVSRLGSLATIRTRSGTVIGGDKHYYTDISSITVPNEDTIPRETIEMDIMGSHSGESSIFHGLNDGTIVDTLESVSNADVFPTYAEEDILDEQAEDFSQGQLILSTESGQVSVGRTFELRLGSTQAEFPGNIIFPPATKDDELLPADNVYPDLTPEIIINIFDDGYDFILHPSLLRKRKKKVFLL